MRCAVLWAAGPACLILGLIVVADEAPPPVRRDAPAVKRAALLGDAQSVKSPLPTQVWWTDRKGDFIVYESGPNRLTEFDSRTRKAASTNAVVGDTLLRDWLVPAPNGDWSARIDQTRAVVSFV